MSNTIKIKQLPTRQRIRTGLLYASFLFFPVTLYYFSPLLIIKSGMEGIINASFIVFGLMFVSSLFFGRLWCGWACPGAALQDFAQPINNRMTPGGKFNWVKWFIWLPWILLIAAPKQCVDYQVCVRNCPMSLDVATIVKSGNMENSECILCGNCADSCGKHAIHFSFSKG